MHKPRALTNRKVERLRRDAEADAKGRLEFKLIIALHLVVAAGAGIGYAVHNAHIRKQQFQYHLQHHHHFGSQSAASQTNTPPLVPVNSSQFLPLSLPTLTNTSEAKPTRNY